MCFSAEASFVATAVIGTIGVVTTKKSWHSQLILLGIIPILFALQQFSEGIIWLIMQSGQTEHLMFELAKYSFLLFAFILWPVWLPLSLFIPEKNKGRKIYIGIMTLLGLLLSGYFISYLPNNAVLVHVRNHSLQYSLKNPFLINEWLIIGIYTFITITPCFVSSLKKTSLYGLLIIIAWLIAEQFYTTNFTSVWCFFCGLISILIYLIIKNNLPSQELKS